LCEIVVEYVRRTPKQAGHFFVHIDVKFSRLRVILKRNHFGRNDKTFHATIADAIDFAIRCLEEKHTPAANRRGINHVSSHSGTH
jgi:hypothetical protein